MEYTASVQGVEEDPSIIPSRVPRNHDKRHQSRGHDKQYSTPTNQNPRYPSFSKFVTIKPGDRGHEELQDSLIALTRNMAKANNRYSKQNEVILTEPAMNEPWFRDADWSLKLDDEDYDGDDYDEEYSTASEREGNKGTNRQRSVSNSTGLVNGGETPSGEGKNQTGIAENIVYLLKNDTARTVINDKEMNAESGASNGSIKALNMNQTDTAILRNNSEANVKEAVKSNSVRSATEERFFNREFGESSEEEDVQLTPLLQTPEFQMLLGDSPRKSGRDNIVNDEKINVRRLAVGNRGSSSSQSSPKSILFWDKNKEEVEENERGLNPFFHGYENAVEAALQAGHVVVNKNNQPMTKYKMVPSKVVITKKVKEAKDDDDRDVYQSAGSMKFRKDGADGRVKGK